ncbi:MAG: FliI/YscN family ATPase [Deltaproteobacteria bacterium]|nr:FliI/YscN family ATPase [Deltaproteobacteria bacterium]
MVNVMSELDALRRRLSAEDPIHVEGRITGLVGLTLRAAAPQIRAGDLVSVQRSGSEPLLAEVVGFDDRHAVLMPLGDPSGVGLGDAVRPVGGRMTIPCGVGLLGRVLDGLGQPCDGLGPITGPVTPWEVERPAPDPLQRQRIKRPLALGVRALDGLLTAGEGQRLGLFAGSGVGKSTLLGQIARQCAADVVVIALVGERGREVREFLEDNLGEDGRRRSCVVVATSDAPALVRLRSAFVATGVAEFFRDQGLRVLLMMDSVTRVARAQREVGLAAGEPPARRGYPPSVFALLPRLLERSGPGEGGTITAVYTVLVEGGDLEEPVADEVRGILDGHVILERSLGSRGRWPAVDVLPSLSRVMDQVATREHRAAAQRFRALLAAYESKRDLITLGAYARGSDRVTDEAIARIDALEAFLRQSVDEASPFDETVKALQALVA